MYYFSLPVFDSICISLILVFASVFLVFVYDHFIFFFCGFRAHFLFPRLFLPWVLPLSLLCKNIKIKIKKTNKTLKEYNKRRYVAAQFVPQLFTQAEPAVEHYLHFPRKQTVFFCIFVKNHNAQIWWVWDLKHCRCVIKTILSKGPFTVIWVLWAPEGLWTEPCVPAWASFTQSQLKVSSRQAADRISKKIRQHCRQDGRANSGGGARAAGFHQISRWKPPGPGRPPRPPREERFKR